MKRIIKNKKNGSRLYYGLIIFYLFIAVFAPILANDKPLFVSVGEKYFFPAFSDDPYFDLPAGNGTSEKIRTNNIDWKNFKADVIIFPPVCWSPVHSDLLNIFASPFSQQHYYRDGNLEIIPFRFRHFLGTGKTGNDVLAGLIHGTRTSVSIGFFSMLIAVILGIISGGLAGYFGDDRLKIRRGSLILMVLMIIPAWFYSFHLRSEIISDAFNDSLQYGIFHLLLSKIIFILILMWPLLLRFSSIPILDKKLSVPVDGIISRFIEIFLSLPRLILILTLAAISRPSVLSIIVIIGITSWTEIARLMRAQVLQLRETNYIMAAKASGIPVMKILSRHLLPNAISQIVVVWTFGIASAILVETGLSFLGIGVPAGTATWGSLMFEARGNLQSWWLVLFTGVALFMLLSSLFIIGNKFKTDR